jgi:hypothetical protein
MAWTWLLLVICPLMMLPIMYLVMKNDRPDTTKQDYQRHLIQDLEQLKNQHEPFRNEWPELKNKLG